MKDAAHVFTKHKDLSHALSRQEFAAVLVEITGSLSVSDLPDGFLNQAFSLTDKNNSGDIDFGEFVAYYASMCFSEHMNCTRKEREFRELCRKHDLSIVEVESYRKFFEEFDSDGSGEIEEDEFPELVRKCAKVPKGVEIPEARFKVLWKEADRDGGGSVDFEEFVLFYRKYFADGCGNGGFEGFYRNIRPVSTVS